MEDDPLLASALRDFFEEEGWTVQWAGTVAEASRKLAETVFDLVLADYLLPDADGLTIFEEIHRRSPLTKVMMMTGVKDMEVASKAFKKGASDLIAKPFKIEELERRISTLMEEKRLQIETEAEETPPKQVRVPPRMVGQSPAIQKVFRLIELVASKNTSVLITGESGTGKELVAHAIHEQSPRKKNPFVAIDCGAIPENLLEDELFGHVSGAYTDARQPRVGRFEQADGGTLFLDEIGNMSLPLQMKFLRVLEEKKVEKLGSNQPIPVSVRVVAATNTDLLQKVKAGEFRGDLFYRLNVVPIQIPPLRERQEDIPLLANYFLRAASAEYSLAEKRLDPQVLRSLMHYDWPGNIRELRNVLELASVLSADRTILGPDDFPTIGDQAGSELDKAETLLEDYLQLPEKGIDLSRVVSELEKSLIRQSLERTQGNKGEAARLLFLKRTTLVEKLRRLNLL